MILRIEKIKKPQSSCIITFKIKKKNHNFWSNLASVETFQTEHRVKDSFSSPM